MDSNDTLLPGSRFCVGCGHITFRKRNDGLCPRCAWQAEQLIEQIELDSLERDLATITRFEAYCHQRSAAGDAVVRPTGRHMDDLRSTPVRAMPPVGSLNEPQPQAGPWPDRRPA